jgi:glycerol-3-phosphate acyltransferase PlsY
MWDENPVWIERHGKRAVATVLALVAALITLAFLMGFHGLALFLFLLLPLMANAAVLAAVLIPIRAVASLYRRARPRA